MYVATGDHLGIDTVAKRKTVALTTNEATSTSRDDLARGVASAMFAGMLVYVTYYPSDSVSIERGDGLWFSAIAIATSTILWAVSSRASKVSSDRSEVPFRRCSTAIDVFAILLAVWMMIAAFGIAGSANLRQATNEAWFWVGATAVLTASRRVFTDLFAKRAAMVLLVGCSVGLGVHALHQHFVSLPRTLDEYRADPDAVLRMAGIDAPAGSATRMVFENRLLDGGPTATFALANSLAGVLVLGFVVVLGLTLNRGGGLIDRSRFSKVSIVVGFVTACVVMVALFLTYSRSGLLAACAGAGIIGMSMLMDRVRETGAGQRSRLAFKLAMTGGAGFVMLVASVMMFAVFGKEEWLAQAPSSLAFRFQYWRATWRLAIDRPWFGAGPGNFQSVYPSYREASAAESIAEPHNFFFETLASGGFVAVAILLAIVVATIALRWQLVRDKTFETDPVTPMVDQSSRWWWLGAGSSLTLIWLLGLATGQSPDWDAQILAVPSALITMLVVWRVTAIQQVPALQQVPSIQNETTLWSDRQVDRIAFAAMASLLLHLVVSGGWTVPGVAVWLWVLVGMWAPAVRSNSPQEVSRQTQMRTRVVSIVAGLVLLLALRLMSLGPIEASASAMRAALVAQSQRQTERAIRELERASSADPWSPESSLWLSDFYRWQLVQNRENDSVAQKWREAGELAIQRSGGDPTLIGLVAAQPLHLFQRWGRVEDLRRAKALYDLACQKSPTNAAFFAQRAEIAERLGDAKRAALDARHATELSQLGENLERRLFVEQILVVEVAGASAQEGPILETADKLLGNQLDTSDVMEQTE